MASSEHTKQNCIIHWLTQVCVKARRKKQVSLYYNMSPYYSFLLLCFVVALPSSCTSWLLTGVKNPTCIFSCRAHGVVVVVVAPWSTTTTTTTIRLNANNKDKDWDDNDSNNNNNNKSASSALEDTKLSLEVDLNKRISWEDTDTKQLLLLQQEQFNVRKGKPKKEKSPGGP